MKHDEFRLKNVDVYNETTSVPRLVPPPLRAVGHDLHRQWDCARRILGIRFCITNDEFCIKNDGFCFKNDGLCIKNDGFRKGWYNGTSAKSKWIQGKTYPCIDCCKDNLYWGCVSISTHTPPPGNIVTTQCWTVCKSPGFHRHGDEQQAPDFIQFFMKHDGFCIKNDGICIKNGELCTKNDELEGRVCLREQGDARSSWPLAGHTADKAFKMMNFATNTENYAIKMMGFVL